MPKSISWRKLIQKFHYLGFTGPYPSGRHLFMTKHQLRVIIPNPHQGDISAGLVTRILRQAGIPHDEWDKA